MQRFVAWLRQEHPRLAPHFAGLNIQELAAQNYLGMLEKEERKWEERIRRLRGAPEADERQRRLNEAQIQQFERENRERRQIKELLAKWQSE